MRCAQVSPHGFAAKIRVPAQRGVGIFFSEGAIQIMALGRQVCHKVSSVNKNDVLPVFTRIHPASPRPFPTPPKTVGNCFFSNASLPASSSSGKKPVFSMVWLFLHRRIAIRLRSPTIRRRRRVIRHCSGGGLGSLASGSRWRQAPWPASACPSTTFPVPRGRNTSSRSERPALAVFAMEQVAGGL